mmetsp:Transcript_10260/g.20602  ORF Transcript_10260/g.20602 Transcript_10260/m.20602 type:complete len:200 (+) Transcript_10260:1-600(+)
MPAEAAAALFAAAGDVMREGEGEESEAAGQQPAEKEEKKPEDLELRRLLAEFTEKRGRDTAKGELNNAAKILTRLNEDSSNTKLHEMRRDLLERIVGEELFFAFEAAGFAERPAQDSAPSIFAWSGDEAAHQVLPAVSSEVQRAADLCLDPDSVSFAQVSELVRQNRTLPGIEDVNDTVATPVPPKDSSMDRPKKPWEK